MGCVRRADCQIPRQVVTSHSRTRDMLVVQADCPGMRRIDVGHVEVGQRGTGLKDGQISPGLYSVKCCGFHERSSSDSYPRDLLCIPFLVMEKPKEGDGENRSQVGKK